MKEILECYTIRIVLFHRNRVDAWISGWQQQQKIESSPKSVLDYMMEMFATLRGLELSDSAFSHMYENYKAIEKVYNTFCKKSRRNGRRKERNYILKS